MGFVRCGHYELFVDQFVKSGTQSVTLITKPTRLYKLPQTSSSSPTSTSAATTSSIAAAAATPCGLVHLDLLAVDHLPVQIGNGSIGRSVITHCHERVTLEVRS